MCNQNMQKALLQEIALTDLTLLNFRACPKPRFGFLTSYVVVFLMFNDLMWEVNIHFLDIDEIVGYHFLFINKIMYNNNCSHHLLFLFILENFLVSFYF